MTFCLNMSDFNHLITILVADDDATIRANLALCCAPKTTASSRRPTASRPRRFSRRDKPLALLDLSMPGLDGMDVLRRHADRLEETPVIVITAYGGSRRPSRR